MLQWILVEVGEVVEELKKQYQMLKMRSIKEAMTANENA
jgi:NTP pyrophosphatase (non-canonical NTP hydrolase)